MVQEFHSLLRSLTRVNPIVIGSNRWNHPSTFASLEPVVDENVLYSFHLYEPLLFTHQRAPWIPHKNFQQVNSYPGDYSLVEPMHGNKLPAETGFWDQSRMRDFLRPVLDFRDRTKLPVACNEFGVFLKADRLSQLAWIEDLMEIFREYDIGYSYWNFKNLDFGIISVNESLHEKLPQYQNPDRLDEELLDILAKG